MGAEKKKNSNHNEKKGGKDLDLLRRVIASTANDPAASTISVDYLELQKSYPKHNVRALQQKVCRLGEKTKGLGTKIRLVGRGKEALRKDRGRANKGKN
ncbi:hypothetical protein PV08_07260 [Exophiala spinifera]|uniref:Uncharacterized protein n=1 Tax=Exophiala spinifera TaxID=91928 RepID=A0A0D1YHU0_9EURO|nr:uncharacterized protein PV08_07260 [Exophiala spinifera]KIW14476.1 hypothetical protein PV08_07260 [Exophiala spinifera]